MIFVFWLLVVVNLNFYKNYVVHRICDNNSSSLKKQMIFEEQQEHELESERLRFSEMQLSEGPTNRLTCFGYSFEELQLSEG